MRVIGQGIEEKICQPVAGEMLRRWLPRCENEALGIDTALNGFAAKIVLDEIIASKSQSTLPGIAIKRRIQMSKNSGVIL
jgi:hypothetical protein